uniref:Uncharacterized protein n=1 Tax=Arundo donax TaxID=35708 RepID=A0A0A8YDI2_ARUDO
MLGNASWSSTLGCLLVTLVKMAHNLKQKKYNF